MNTFQSIFPMNDQHRATDSEWHCLEARTCGDKADMVAYSCILELRNRIKALEASQPEHLIDPERERTAKEFMQAAGFAPRPSEPRPSEVAARIRAAADARAKSNHPAKPNSSLVHRVACAFYTYGSGDGFREEARDAIREIAAWLREEKPHMAGNCSSFASLLEQEAKR